VIIRLLIVFVLSILTEACYTGYAYYVARGDTVRGPTFAGLIAVGKAVLVLQYVREPLAIAALAVGQVAGTWLTLTVIQWRIAVPAPVAGGGGAGAVGGGGDGVGSGEERKEG